MIFYFNASGDILSAVFDEVYQGSNMASEIYFLCPTASSNIVSVAFTLPDGTDTPRHVMEHGENVSLNGVYDEVGGVFNVWKFKVPSAITCKRGTVRVQFFITTPTETVATASVDFTVRKGVSNVVPEIGNSYNELVTLMSEFSTRVTSAEDDVEECEADIAAIDLAYGATLDFSVNNSTYVLTASLKNKNGTVLSTNTVDLPLESVVVDGSYNNSTKSLVLTLKNGTQILIPIGALIGGLQSEITILNKLSADLIDDTGTTNKLVSSAEKTVWNGKVDSSVKVAGIALSTDISAASLLNALFDITEVSV